MDAIILSNICILIFGLGILALLGFMVWCVTKE